MSSKTRAAASKEKRPAPATADYGDIPDREGQGPPPSSAKRKRKSPLSQQQLEEEKSAAAADASGDDGEATLDHAPPPPPPANKRTRLSQREEDGVDDQAKEAGAEEGDDDGAEGAAPAAKEAAPKRHKNNAGEASARPAKKAQASEPATKRKGRLAASTSSSSGSSSSSKNAKKVYAIPFAKMDWSKLYAARVPKPNEKKGGGKGGKGEKKGGGGGGGGGGNSNIRFGNLQYKVFNDKSGKFELKNFFVSYTGRIHMDVEPKSDEYKPAITFELEKGGADHQHLLRLNEVMPRMLKENWKTWGVSSKITHHHLQEYGKPKPPAKEVKDDPAYEDEVTMYKKNAKEGTLYTPSTSFTGEHYNTSLKIHIPTRGRVVDEEKYFIKDEQGRQEDATGSRYSYMDLKRGFDVYVVFRAYFWFLDSNWGIKFVASKIKILGRDGASQVEAHSDEEGEPESTGGGSSSSSGSSTSTTTTTATGATTTTATNDGAKPTAPILSKFDQFKHSLGGTPAAAAAAALPVPTGPAATATTPATTAPSAPPSAPPPPAAAPAPATAPATATKKQPS